MIIKFDRQDKTMIKNHFKNQIRESQENQLNRKLNGLKKPKHEEVSQYTGLHPNS